MIVRTKIIGHYSLLITRNTNTLRAWDFYEVTVDEGEARINYHLIEIESE